MTTRVAVIGASGYTGAELVRLLLGHPHVALTGVFAKSSAGKRLAEVFPQLTGVVDLVLEPVEIPGIVARADVVFSALPHGESAPVVAALVESGVRVLDLSADFRLRDPHVHRQWYAEKRPQELADRAVYGLPERHRERLRGAGLVAVPGCYPTASILAAWPLLAEDLIEPRPLIIDAKSGVSGAGRTPTLGTHFSEIGEGVRAYKAAGAHRHTPEIEQELSLVAGVDLRVTFTPQLVPMSRGILACFYARPRKEVDFRAAYLRRYEREPFVTLLPPGVLPDTSHVRGTNRAHVQVLYDARADMVVAMVAIDNLGKGAAGQAVQCLNAVMGWPENLGLLAVAPFP